MRITEDLIRRIERSEAQLLARSARTTGGDVLEFGTGVAAFCGPGDVLTQTAAIGIDGQLSDEEWAQLWGHYAGRCEKFEFKLSPMAAVEVAHKVAEHAAGLSEFETFLVQEITSETGRLDDRIVEVPVDERRAYVELTAPWFYPGETMPPGLIDTIAGALQNPQTRVYAIRFGGEIIAGASLSVQDGIAWLSGGVVRPNCRMQGNHRALIAHRLAVAHAQGAEFACQGAHPGSQSQLNAQSNGFSVAFTRPSLLVRPSSP